MKLIAFVFSCLSLTLSPAIFAEKRKLVLECVPFGESKNGFLILDLPDVVVERNVKSKIGFVTLVTFRKRVQYARQPGRINAGR